MNILWMTTPSGFVAGAVPVPSSFSPSAALTRAFLSEGLELTVLSAEEGMPLEDQMDYGHAMFMFLTRELIGLNSRISSL